MEAQATAVAARQRQRRERDTRPPALRHPIVGRAELQEDDAQGEGAAAVEKVKREMKRVKAEGVTKAEEERIKVAQQGWVAAA